jgi:hypothetical protein
MADTLNGAARGRALSIVVHADTKVGKSTLASTCPKPMCFLDAESAYRFIDQPKVFWNPLTEAPPVSDGTWSICVVIVRDYQTLHRAVEWLKSGQHHFKSVAVDSISEVQKKLKDQIKEGDPDMEQRKWGRLLDGMEALCRDLRDLTEHPTTPLEAVVLTAMTEMREGKWRPYVQGQLRTTMPYFMDVIGFMEIYEHPNEDPMQPPTRYRRMIIAKNPRYETGERVNGKLGEVIYNPNVVEMVDAVFGKTEVPVSTTVVPAEPAQEVATSATGF